MKLFTDKSALELEIKTLKQELARATEHVKQGQEEILRIAKERDELSDKASSMAYDLVKEKERADAMMALHTNTQKVLDDVRKKIDEYEAIVDITQEQEYCQFLVEGSNSREYVYRRINEKLSNGYTVHSITSSVYGTRGDCIVHVVLNLPKVTPTTKQEPQP